MTTIWVVDWELGDEGAVVTVGDDLDWLACAPDRTTLRLDERPVDLHMSPDRLWGYGHPAIGVAGRVAGIEAVLQDVRRTRTSGSMVRGSEVLEPVASTNDRWWDLCLDHALAGFLVTLHDAVVSHDPATVGRSEWHRGTGPMPSSSPPPATPRWAPEPDPAILARMRPGDTFVGVSYERPPASVCPHPAHRT